MNTMLKRFLLSGLTIISISSCAVKSVQRENPKLTFSYAILKLKDVDEMSAIVKKELLAYKKDENSEHLIGALTTALSRPNSDNILERVLLTFRLGLETNELWESTTEKLVDKAVGALKSPVTSAIDQVNYAFVLQNLLVEFVGEFHKPDANPKFERHIIEKVAASDILISDEAVNEADLNMVGHAVSPSEIAKEILLELNAEKKLAKPVKK